MALLGSSRPVRALRPSQRGVTGRVPLSDSSSAGHESSLERDWLILLDFDRRVSRLLEQPFTLYYELDGRRRRYTPDIQATFLDRGREYSVVYEVKYRADLAENWNFYRPRFKAAISHCFARGWRFKLVTEREIRGIYLENVRFLRRYKLLEVQSPHHEALLLSLAALGPTTPQGLLEATWYDRERRMAALTELWRMVAVGKIAVDLTAPLTMACSIWRAEE